MADAVWDLQKAMRGPDEAMRPRADSEPTVVIAENKALDIAFPGGFRRDHLSRNMPPVSQPLRQAILRSISNVYDPFIGSILSQDNDLFDDFQPDERVKHLLQTPVFQLQLPTRFVPPLSLESPDEEGDEPSETTKLLLQRKITTVSASREGEAGKTTTLWHALLTLLKSFVGTGILFLPDGFRSGGLLFSPLCLAVVAFLSLYAMIRLLQCRALIGGTYGHIGEVTYGKWGHRMVQISTVLMQFGFCCTYIIFVAQNIAEVLHYMGFNFISTAQLIVLQIFVYIPLSWIRYISYFSISNLIADLLILYGIVVIVANSMSLLSANGVATGVEYFNRNDYPVFIGTAVFTFEGIGLVLPTQGTLNKARQAKFPGLLTGTVMGLLVFYIGFATINYLAYGDMIQPMVCSSLPRNGWSISVQFGYALAQLLSYPLFLFPAVKIMEEMLGFPKRASGLKMQKNAFRALAVVVTVGIAYFGQDHLDLFVSIVGAFCCVPLSFIYPPLFYMKLQPKAPLYERLVDSCVATIGTLTFFYVTYSNLSKWTE